MRTEIYIKPRTKRPQNIPEAIVDYELRCIFDDGRQEARGGHVALKNASIKKASLVALIEALKRFNRPQVIKVFIEEPFVRAMLIQGCPSKWKANNWMRIRKGCELHHKEEWQQLTDLMASHAISISKENEDE